MWRTWSWGSVLCLRVESPLLCHRQCYLPVRVRRVQVQGHQPCAPQECIVRGWCAVSTRKPCVCVTPLRSHRYSSMPSAVTEIERKDTLRIARERAASGQHDLESATASPFKRAAHVVGAAATEGLRSESPASSHGGASRGRKASASKPPRASHNSTTSFANPLHDSSV